jgi:hypothetical protein
MLVSCGVGNGFEGPVFDFFENHNAILFRKSGQFQANLCHGYFRCYTLHPTPNSTPRPPRFTFHISHKTMGVSKVLS